MPGKLNIVISGMFGQINVGDEAISHADVTGLRRVLPDSHCRIITYDASRSQAFTGTEDVSYFEGQCFTHRFWMRFPGFIRMMRQADLVVVGGGGLFQDQYKWHLPAGSALVAALGVLFGTPTYIVGVGVGPLRRNWLKRIIARIFSAVNLVMVRDVRSLDAAIEIGSDIDNLRVTGDVVPSLDYAAIQASTRTAAEKTICLVLRDWPGLDREKLSGLLDKLTDENYTVELHAYEPGKDDLLYQQVLVLCKPATRDHVSIIVPATLSESVALLKEACCVISMRYHGCVFSAGLGVPLLPVMYERKVKSLSKQLGIEAWLKVPGDLGDGLAGDIVRLCESGDEYQAIQTHGFNALRASARENFQLIKQDFDQRGATVEPLSQRLRVLPAIILLLTIGLVGELQRILTMPFRYLGSR